MTGSSSDGFRLPAPGSRTILPGVATAIALVLSIAVAAASGEETVLNLRAKVVSAATGGALTITLLRWSTDAERSPLVAALSAPPPAPAPAAGGRAAGRGGRGAAPPTPAQRLATAVRAAPTLGFIWGEGVTGYSIKYAWRSPSTDRVIFVIDRRLGAHAPEWGLEASTAPEPDFTVIELHLDGAGGGEGKSSLSAAVIVDPAEPTLALDRFAAAPALFKVSR